MRGYLGIETGLPKYPVKPSGISFSIDPKLADIRPVLGAAVIRGVTFDDESIQSIMRSAGAGARWQSASMIWTR